MPDLVTHFCTACVTARMVRIRFFALFALGVILPDLLSRPFHILFPALFWYLTPFHSPLVCVLYCALFSLFLAPGLRLAGFFSLLAGAGLHLLFDLFQVQLCPAYYWFFPFSWRSFWLGLFWPEQALFFLPATILLTALICLMTRSRH